MQHKLISLLLAFVAGINFLFASDIKVGDVLNNSNEIDFFTNGCTYVEARYMNNINGYQFGDWDIVATIMSEEGSVQYIASFTINSGENNKIAGTYDITGSSYNKGGKIYDVTSGTLTITYVETKEITYPGGTIVLPVYEFKVTDMIMGETTVSASVQGGVRAYEYSPVYYGYGYNVFYTLTDDKTETPDDDDEPDAPVSDNCFDMNQIGNWSMIRCLNYDFGVVSSDYEYFTRYGWTPSLSPDNHPRQTLITRQGKDKICRQLDVLTPDKRASIRLASDNYAQTDYAKGAVIACYFDVTEDNAFVKLQYAAVMHTPEHTIVTQDGFKDFAQPHIHIDVIDASTGTSTYINSYSVSHYPSDASTIQGWKKGSDADGNHLIWKDWSSVTYDFSAYVGKRLAIMLTTYDCAESGYDSENYYIYACMRRHLARLYFNLSCGSPSDNQETTQKATVYQDCSLIQEQGNTQELPQGRMAMQLNSSRLNAPATDKLAVIVSSDGCDSHTTVYAAEGETVTVNAIAKDGWKFDKWSDGSTDNPYEITVTKEMTLVAYFRQNEAGESKGVSVTSDTNTADFVWKTINEASTYELIISDLQGNTICVLTFNAYGQLLSISFSAPARNNASEPLPTDGFFFTVTGLNEATTYNYTLTAMDSDGNTLDIKEGTFKTKGIATDLEDMSVGSETLEVRKIFIDGVLYIRMPDGRMYDMQGKEVK